MSYVAVDATGYLTDIASVSGWSAFVDWAEHGPKPLQKFIRKGMTDNPRALATALHATRADDPANESVRSALLAAANAAQEILILSDGTSDEREPTTLAGFDPSQERDEYGRWTGGDQAFYEQNRVKKAMADRAGMDTTRLTAADNRTRARLKARIVGDLGQRLLQRADVLDGIHPKSNLTLVSAEDHVQERIDEWADSSADSVLAAQLQQAVMSEFGLKDADTEHIWNRGLSGDPASEKQDAINRAFLRAEYEVTQDFLKELGVSHVPLYRGTMQRIDKGSQTVTMQPASSWTLDPVMASDFAGIGGTVLTARVPVERILSTSVTGRGALHEAEVIVLGGDIDVKAFPGPSRDAFAGMRSWLQDVKNAFKD